MATDPNDFVENEDIDTEEPEGRVPSPGQKSGLPGVGGLTTDEAEDAYMRATREKEKVVIGKRNDDDESVDEEKQSE